MIQSFPFRNDSRIFRAASSVLCIAAALFFAIAMSGFRIDEPAQRQVAYPEGYREWVHVKSGVIGPEFPAYETEGGIHHVYGNEKALSGLQSGKFDDGSILVYDLVSMSTKGGVSTEGARRRADVMVKDSKLYPDSGGWGFGRFMGDDHERDVLTAQVRQTCYQCHQNRKDHDLVFSEFRP